MGAETNLDGGKGSEFSDIPGFAAKRFDSLSRKTGRGLILYSRLGIDIYNVEILQQDNLEVVQFSASLLNNDIKIIFLYRSLQHPISKFKQDLQQILQDNCHQRNLLILGDFNEEDNVIDDASFVQLIDAPTVSGIKGSRIDHAYARLPDFKCSGHVLYKCFVKSYHHPICVNLQSCSDNQ